MKIVVTTPTGNVGTRVVQLLVQAGVRPTLILRDAGKLEPELRELVDTVEGDQRDADVVMRATAGADALYWVNPPVDADDPIAAQRELAELVARAVKDNAIGRTVFQSSVGAELREGAGDIDGLAAVELALDATGASVCYLRCGFFFTNLLIDPGLGEGVLRIARPVDEPLPWVDPRDIGEVAAAWLLNAAWSGRQVEAVHGPADLSFTAACEILSDVIGRPFRAEQIPDDEFLSGLKDAGMTDEQAEAILGMSFSKRDGFTPEQPRSLRTTTPTTLAAWAQERKDVLE